MGMKRPLVQIRGKQYANCRLCNESSKLRQSHIVSEFCYSYDETGPSRFALGVMVPAGVGVPKMDKVQKGYREYLLCKGCEQRIRAYETPFSTFWRDKVLAKAPFRFEEIVEIHGADYHSMKMFLLSVFWRVSVSELFGQTMKLGPYAEKLRSILLENKSVRQNHYPLMGTLILDDVGTPFHGLVSQPTMRRFEHSRAYSMHFCGCAWTLVMSDHWVPRKSDAFQQAVRESGKLLLRTRHHAQDPFLRMMSQRLRANDS